MIIQGTPGSYSAQAAATWYPDETITSVRTFAEAAERIRAGERGLLPIENSHTGPIDDCLREIEGIPILETHWLRIEHCLISHPGIELEEVQFVFSHKEALRQCGGLLAEHEFQGIATADTASAVADVKGRRKRTEAAIASRAAAELHGMHVLLEDVADAPDNQTLFALLAK
ncbi:MAG: prephenate dehydratase domain-containing protein [Thermoplasmatota archaeon]